MQLQREEQVLLPSSCILLFILLVVDVVVDGDSDVAREIETKQQFASHLLM